MKSLFLKTKKARYIVMGFFLFLSYPSLGQEWYHSVEKLESNYEAGKYPQKIELMVLRELSREEKDPQKKLKYSEKLIKLATEQDSTHYFFDAYMQKGSALRLKSDLTMALSNFIKAAEIAKNIDHSESLIALSNVAIADVYSVMGNHENSVKYYESGIAKLREIKADSMQLATALFNAGDEYLNSNDNEKAMSYFYESSLIANKIGNKVISAYNLGNIGMIYAKQGRHRLARANLDEAIKILEGEKIYDAISTYLKIVSDIYLEQNKPVLAKIYAIRSLELSKKYQLKEQISSASLELSRIYEQLNQPKDALFHLNEYVVYKDSVTNIEAVQKMANLRTEFEVEKKQTELDLLEQKQKSQRITIYAILGGLLLTGLLAFGLFRRNLFIKRTSEIIRQEREKSDNLLHNILPEEAAEELRTAGKVTSKKFQSVTVLFTDFKGFTKIAESLNPEKLVESVDFYFSKFDEILDKYNLEKIKTIGDAYMVAGGLPTPVANHAELVANAAVEIRDFVNTAKMKHAVGEVRFDIRIGLHTGPVVAGVVGKNKFAYDIWGDTVNIASRMETASEAGKINVSETTYELIKDSFTFESRGSIDIKNRSAINMYFLKQKTS